MARLSESEWEDIKARWCSGLEDLRTIAEDYGIDHTTIGKKAKRDGWVAAEKSEFIGAVDALADAKRKVAQLANSTNSPKIPQLVEILADRKEEAEKVGMTLLQKIQAQAEVVEDAYELKELTTGFKQVFEPMFKDTRTVINNTNAQQNNAQPLPTRIKIVAPQ